MDVDEGDRPSVQLDRGGCIPSSESKTAIALVLERMLDVERVHDPPSSSRRSAVCDLAEENEGQAVSIQRGNEPGRTWPSSRLRETARRTCREHSDVEHAAAPRDHGGLLLRSHDHFAIDRILSDESELGFDGCPVAR